MINRSRLSNYYGIFVDGRILSCHKQEDCCLKKEKKRLYGLKGIEIRRVTMLELQDFNLRKVKKTTSDN